jgi:hypothetical protein
LHERHRLESPDGVLRSRGKYSAVKSNWWPQTAQVCLVDGITTQIMNGAVRDSGNEYHIDADGTPTGLLAPCH